MTTKFLRGTFVVLALMCLAGSAFHAQVPATLDAPSAQDSPGASVDEAPLPAEGPLSLPSAPDTVPAPTRVSSPERAPERVVAQAPAPPSAPQDVVPPAAASAAPAADEPSEDRRSGREAVRIGSDYVLRQGDTVDEAVVVGGSATIEGRVDGDLGVVLGSARLSSTAAVGGDLVVVGGNLTIEPGATVDREMVVVAGSVDAPVDFKPGGEQVLIGTRAIGEGFRALGPWVTSGLFWGRPIVPSLPWVWAVWAAFVALYLALNLLVSRPVRGIAEHVTERPLSAFMVGLLVLVLLGPVMVLLAVSVIGLIVIPFLLGAVFIAGLLGRVGVLRAVGASILGQSDPESPMQSARSLLLGVAVLTLVYIVPVLGLVAWALLGVLALGAGGMACATALRRENPPPVMPATPVVPGAAPPPPPIPLGADGPGRAEAPPAEMPRMAPEAATPQPDLSFRPRATFLDRLGAFALDVLLVLLTFGLLDLHGRGPGRFFLLLLVYRVGFWAWKGTTIGGIICHLRVVRTDGAPLRFGDALVRGLASIFSFAVLGLGCLFILRDRERQAWHDRIAGTYVVKVPPSTPW